MKNTLENPKDFRKKLQELDKRDMIRKIILEKRESGEPLTEQEEAEYTVWLAEGREEDARDLEVQNKRR